MTCQRLSIFAVVMLVTALVPIDSPAQSGTSSNEVRELQKQLEDLREQMSKIEARLNQLPAQISW